ncbi:uncharacterized protein JCM6883_006880 [Sporobolomyces salmoneus]|uniref:uncharacterized protein n=1 Tax=Sporobolomyces salmoneus TaxID=183962 RepID=UPI00317B6497
MAPEYRPLPSSRPTSPPSRTFSRSLRSFNRESRPDSLTLSPASIYSWTETDAFLSPRTRPSTPGSPYSIFHPPSSPHEALLLSPRQNTELELEKTSKGYFELKLPPSAKRKTRKSRVWLALLGGGVALVFLSLGVITVLRGGEHPQVEAYTGKIAQKVSQLKEKVSEKWNEAVVSQESEEETFDEPSSPLSPTENYDVGIFEDSSDVSLGDTGPIEISLLPKPRLPSIRNNETRYLGFLPHSGVHNQRIALQNALLLGKLLNRTVLVPPIWIGWPTSTLPYEDLAKAWTHIMLLNPGSFNLSSIDEPSPLNLPANYSSTLTSFPCPTCDADDPEKIADHLRQLEERREKWLAKGYKLRVDGFPTTELTAAECKSYSPECRHTYRDTFISYDFLVDLDKVREQGVEIVDRWDTREKAIEGLLGVEEKDIFVLKDRQSHDFLFTDRNKTVDSPLITPSNHSNWNREVSLPTLAARQDRVILVGSLFGSGRVHTAHPEAQAWSEAFARALAFDNEWLLRPADAIVARLGGPYNFVGVHARVGDGEFSRHARRNMKKAWKELVRKLGYDGGEAQELWEKMQSEGVETEEEEEAKKLGKRHSQIAAKVRGKRSAIIPPITFPTWSHVDDDADYSDLISSPPSSSSRRRLEKRSSEPDADDIWFFLRGPTGEPSALLRNLNCRAPLHTEPNLKALNIPLYLATDSRSPTTDPNLAPFFAAFPCTFILSDFDHPNFARNDGLAVESVGEMGRLQNEIDGVPLGRLFLPFLEAIVAAKGRITVGTTGSTFSGFATGALHDAYREQ